MKVGICKRHLGVKILELLDVSYLMRGGNALLASFLMLSACVRMILVVGVRDGGMIGGQCVGKWKIGSNCVWGQIPK